VWRRHAVSTARSRSWPRSADDAAAAAGCARTTSSAPSGSPSRRAATSARRRRLTRLRVTALPTALDTTRPTAGGPGSVVVVRCATSVPRPPRAPRRTVCWKSAERRIRCVAGSTGRCVRPRARCAPCGDAPRGWRDRHACACADGSRGSWPGAGCSAGRCAWSRRSPHVCRSDRTQSRDQVLVPGPTAPGNARGDASVGVRARRTEPLKGWITLRSCPRPGQMRAGP